ncbi:hypothetical protein ACFPLB_12575 [Aquamicrobium segne]|uniref:Uncharacterized protein n=1 Tax=Aquamicrobium segne TaxID=469547 RepID=A0ABW0GYQ1_9HYPH
MRNTIPLSIVLSTAILDVASAQEWRSAYTDTGSSNCITLAVEPGQSAELACPGYKGYPLLIRDGDLRMFVSYGFDARDEMAASQTMPGFNTIGEKLEWLIADHPDLGEQPVATILRYRLDRSEGFIPDTQVLVVTRIEPGNTCHVAYIDAVANQNANVLARQAAADLVPGWDCRTMEVRWIGNLDLHTSR